MSRKKEKKQRKITKNAKIETKEENTLEAIKADTKEDALEETKAETESASEEVKTEAAGTAEASKEKTTSEEKEVGAEAEKENEAKESSSKEGRKEPVWLEDEYIPRSTALLSIMAVLLLGLTLILASMNHSKEGEISTLKREIEKRDAIIEHGEVESRKSEEKIKQIDAKLSRAEKDAIIYKTKYKFFDEKLVIASEKDGLFHKYDCPKLDLSDYFLTTSEAALEVGYEPCPECISDYSQEVSEGSDEGQPQENAGKEPEVDYEYEADGNKKNIITDSNEDAGSNIE